MAEYTFPKMEYLSQKVLHRPVAETVHEISVPCTPITCYRKIVPYSTDGKKNPNSIQSRSCSLYSTADAKIGFEEPSKTVNGENHSSIWRLSEVSYLKKEETARATTGPAEQKCVRNTYISGLDNEQLRECSISETQKLKDIENWAELFLDQSPIGDIIQEHRQSILDHCILKKMFQNSRGKDSISKRPDTFDPELLHTNILSGSVVFENSSENFEQETPGTLVNNNTSCSPRLILNSIQAAKHGNKRLDITISTKIWEECIVNNSKHSTTRESSFQNIHLVSNRDDSCIPTRDLHKNENYFWAPLSDSSDEEWTDMKKNNLKWTTVDSKKHKNLADSANFDNPANMKYFSLSMPEDKFAFKIMSDSCKKWNPGTGILEIPEYKCKNFTQTPRHEDFSGTQNAIKSNYEETKNGNIHFHSKSAIKNGMLRDQMLDIQTLKRASNRRNEPKLEQMLEVDKIFKGRKNTREQEVNFNKTSCNIDQNEAELISPYPVMQIKSSSVGSLLKPLENNTYKVGSDSLNISCKTRNKSNSDCVLLVGLPQISDDQVAHQPCAGQGSVNDNISVTGLQSADEEFLITTVNGDGHKQPLCNSTSPLDFSHSNSVLAKYYFYLNYLNKSKRFQCENASHLFFCQEHAFFKEAYDTGPCYSKNDSTYEEQTDENMNNDLGTSEGNRRTEIIKQQNHFEEQVLKPLFANSNSKQRQMGKTGSFKDQEVSESKRISTKWAGPKKHWERASISCLSYTQRKLKPSRSQCVQRPGTGKKLIRKNSCNSQSHPSSGIESRQQYENVPQSYNKLNMKRHSDRSLTPWLLLPDELWLCIFSMLTHKDISQISQVCHRFYRLAGDKSIWKKIQLKDCHCLNDDWLISLGKHHPECFTLDRCHDKYQRISEVGLKQFFQYCEGFLKDHIAVVRSQKRSSCFKELLTGRNFQAPFLLYSGSLVLTDVINKELNIKNCSGSGFKGDRVLLHASAFCHNLAVIDISWTGATDLGLIALVKASRSLQCFSANGCQITNDSVIALIGKHGKSLKKLEIFGCHAVTDKCLKSIAMKCPGLEILNIGRVHRITQGCLVKMVNSLQKLTSLNITGLEMMRDCLVHCILMRCPKLECLVLNSCAHITDISLIEISTYLPMIRYLDVNGCKGVTDTGIQALAGNCHKLSYLDLSSTATSKRGVCLLANFCFSTLECLKLSFCRNISLDAVAKLCKNCKRLRMLHLYGCRFIPDLESIKEVNKTVKIFHDLPVATVKLSE